MIIHAQLLIISYNNLTVNLNEGISYQHKLQVKSPHTEQQQIWDSRFVLPFTSNCYPKTSHNYKSAHNINTVKTTQTETLELLRQCMHNNECILCIEFTSEKE